MTVEAPLPSTPSPRPRIQTLADLIFGLALSIGAISLQSAKPDSAAALAGSLTVFGFSFLILALVWVRYTRIMSVLQVETGREFAANMALLFLVSIEPYLFNLISLGSGSPLGGDLATAAYALDFGFMNLILSFSLHQVISDPKKLIPIELRRSFRLQRNLTFLAVILFMVSALPVFWSFSLFGLQARFYFWFVPLAATPLRIVAERGSSKARAGALAKLQGSG